MAIKKAVQRMLKGGGKKEEPLWAFVKEKFELGCELRRPFEQRWLMQLNFLSGKQYVFYNQGANLVQHIAQAKGRLRVVDNKILPRFQKQVSRMIRSSPRMSVVPATTDQSDIKAAKGGDKVLKHFWRQHQMRKKVRQLATWIYSCGNGYLDDRWNEKLGPEVVGKDGKLYYSGDADVGVWSPFEIGVPAGGLGDQDLHSQPWIWKAKFRPLEWFETNYGELGKGVKEEQRPIPFVDAGRLFGLTDGTTTHKQPGAVHIQLYVQPCGEYPKGLFVSAANGIILAKDDYPFTQYNLEQFKDIEVPGCFHGMATTEAAIWLQKVWNRTLSDIAEFNRTMARGKWLYPRGAKVETGPDDSHGQVLHYTPVMGHKPEMMDLKGLPATYQQTLMIVAASFMDLYSQHEVTQGTNKSDLRSGDMVSQLLEQDDFGNLPTHAIFEEGLEAVMGRVLKRIQVGYKEERTLAIVGEAGELEVFAFKGADLKNNTDVFVVRDSSIPEGRLARQMRTMQNFEKGIYGNPADERVRQKVLRLVEDVPGDFKDIFEEGNLDRQNALLENAALLSQPGVTLLPNPYDSHEIHLEEHRMAKKQPEYQRLKRENPAGFVTLEMTFMKHEQLHVKFLVAQRQLEDDRLAKMQKGG